MKLLLYSTQPSPRLQYIFTIFCNTIGITSFELTNDLNYYNAFIGARINYSELPVAEEECWVYPAKLLFETNITPQQFSCFERKGYKCFFSTGKGDFSFDVFAASFYLLCRYEEYLPHVKDEYGRFAHTNSLAYKEGFLHLPLVNFWLQECARYLQHKFAFKNLRPPFFKFLPTYDIDIAWSYFSKGFKRNLGGLMRNVLRGEWQLTIERAKVLLGSANDPFDVYEWLDGLHEQYSLHPIYFFLVADKRGRYDKNIHPQNINFKLLISKLSVMYGAGIHPSWQSSDQAACLQTEISTLKKVTRKDVVYSRQHYIRMQLPETYRQLIKAGIQYDFSMGYGSINGFRASYCMPYKWFDLANNQCTSLSIFPFCYMDANAQFEEKLSPHQALKQMEHYCQVTRQVNGTLVTVFHNHLLTEQPAQAAWRHMYQQFLQDHF
jgi:hypothetical protein